MNVDALGRLELFKAVAFHVLGVPLTASTPEFGPLVLEDWLTERGWSRVHTPTSWPSLPPARAEAWKSIQVVGMVGRSPTLVTTSKPCAASP